MRRAVGVYERIIRRFTAQDTDYQLLLSTFAEGLYTEMDFRNEALNMERMTVLMEQSEFGSRDVIIPKPVMERTTRWRSWKRIAWLLQSLLYADLTGFQHLTTLSSLVEGIKACKAERLAQQGSILLVMSRFLIQTKCMRICSWRNARFKQGAARNGYSVLEQLWEYAHKVCN